MKKYYKVVDYDDKLAEKHSNQTLEWIKEKSIPNFDIGYVFWANDKRPPYTFFPFGNRFSVNVDDTYVKEITQKEYFELQRYPQDDPTFKKDLEKFIKSEYKIGDKFKSLARKRKTYTIEDLSKIIGAINERIKEKESTPKDVFEELKPKLEKRIEELKEESDYYWVYFPEFYSFALINDKEENLIGNWEGSLFVEKQLEYKLRWKHEKVCKDSELFHKLVTIYNGEEGFLKDKFFACQNHTLDNWMHPKLQGYAKNLSFTEYFFGELYKPQPKSKEKPSKLNYKKTKKELEL